MKKHLSLLVLAVLLLSGCQYFSPKPVQKNLVPSESRSSTASLTIIDSKTELPSDTVATQYSIYLIALDDKGLNGKEIGCGDSVVAAIQSSQKSDSNNSDLLKEAFDNLLSLKNKDYGESGLNNFLANSSLKLISAEIKDAKAIVKLSGQLSLAGVCDTPRVKAQLEETAAQFDNVTSVEIHLNNKTLEQATSLKG